MALRWQNSGRTHSRVPSYYVNNKSYPGSYAPTERQTRSSRRNHEGLVLDKNFGLDTTSDDVNSSPYSSPYYINGRFNSDQLTTQRGNSASIQGNTALLTLKSYAEDFTSDDIDGYIKLWQGKQIMFSIPYHDKIVGNTITLRNTKACTGILSIYLSAEEDSEPFYETAVNLSDISEDVFKHIELKSNLVMPRDANPRETIYVRMEIWNEVSETRSSNPFNTGRYIEIAATGKGNHDEVIYKLSDKNTPIVEDYSKLDIARKPMRPCMGLVYNQWASIPVWRTEPSANGATVAKNGYLYDIYCITNGTESEVVIYDVLMNTTVTNQIKVDGRAKEVHMVQGKDWVYYTDGYSPLQKFQVGAWVSQALPLGGAKDPKNAPSIITKANNRLYLSGFKADPNLVQVTEIDTSGAQFDQFPYSIYVPNQSPSETSMDPVTAMVEIESDTIMILGRSCYTKFTSNVAIEAGTNTPKQVSTYTDGGGVLSAGDVCNYQGRVYSFNKNEGIRRFNGSTWEKIPASLDSHIARVDLDKPRKLWGFGDKLYFNYTDLIDGKYKCLVWDMEMNYQQYPWFMDEDVPFCDYRYDSQYEIRGIHPDYPCIMRLYAPDTWRRLDTPIKFERHTKYISLPGNSDDMLLKRVHNKVLASSTGWWYFALSFDKHDLDPTRGKERWWRLPVWNTEVYNQAYGLPFPVQDDYEKSAISVLSLLHIRIKCISVQEKIMCKTFNSQANLISTVFEAQACQYV